MFRPDEAAVLTTGLVGVLRIETTIGGSATPEEVRGFLAALPVDQFDSQFTCKAVANAVECGIAAIQRKGSATRRPGPP